MSEDPCDTCSPESSEDSQPVIRKVLKDQEDLLLVLLIYFTGHSGAQIVKQKIFEVWEKFLHDLGKKGFDTKPFHADNKSLSQAFHSLVERQQITPPNRTEGSGYIYVEMQDKDRRAFLRTFVSHDIDLVNEVLQDALYQYRKLDRKHERR